MTESQPQESDQLPEEAPAGQVPDSDGETDRASERRAEADRDGQGESRGEDSGDETAQTGNPQNAG